MDQAPLRGAQLGESRTTRLIPALLEARDLLPQLFYLVLEVLLPAPHPGVAALEDGAKTIHDLDHRSAEKADRGVEPAECRLAGRAGGGGRSEGPYREAAHRSHGSSDKELRRPLAQPKTPSGIIELRRGQFSTGTHLQSRW